MKFSAIIPTLGRSEYLKEAVDAILKQTYQDFEIIVVNDGEYVELPNDQRILQFPGEKKGITGAMNLGMKVAKGDVFCEANDDDKLLPHAFERVNETLKDGAYWCYGLIERGGGHYGQPWDYQTLKRNNIVPQPAAFWTRKSYEEVGAMNGENDLVSDYEYWLRLGKNWEPVFINEPLAWYREWPGQITQSRQAEQLAQAQKVREKYA